MFIGDIDHSKDFPRAFNEHVLDEDIRGGKIRLCPGRSGCAVIVQIHRHDGVLTMSDINGISGIISI